MDDDASLGTSGPFTPQCGPARLDVTQKDVDDDFTPDPTIGAMGRRSPRPVSVGDVVSRERRSAPTIGRAVTGLEEHGVVEPVIGRLNGPEAERAELTSRGRALATAIPERERSPAPTGNGLRLRP